MKRSTFQFTDADIALIKSLRKDLDGKSIIGVIRLALKTLRVVIDCGKKHPGEGVYIHVGNDIEHQTLVSLPIDCL